MEQITNISTNGIIITGANPVVQTNHQALASLPAALAVLGVMVLLYVFYCYCLKCICEKCGQNPGLLIWLPLGKTIRILQAGGLSGWWFLLFFLPGVNVIMTFVMWIKVCIARGKSGWLTILLLIPVANLFFIPYLAFSE